MVASYTLEYKNNAATYARQIKLMIDKFEAPQDDLARTEVELENVVKISHKSMEKVIGRGHQLDTLLEKTDMLDQSGKKFYSSTRRLKNSFWRDKIKMYMAIIVGCVVLFYIFTIWLCGFQSCFPAETEETATVKMLSNTNNN